MATQLSDAVRNARLNAIETAIGASAVLIIYELTDPGSPPANCADGIAGTALVKITLPADWLAAASGGSASKSGVWQGISIAIGNADFFRLYEATETTCHMQGTVTVTGGGGDMEIDIVSILFGSTVTVETFSLTSGNP